MFNFTDAEEVPVGNTSLSASMFGRHNIEELNFRTSGEWSNTLDPGFDGYLVGADLGYFRLPWASARLVKLQPTWTPLNMPARSNDPEYGSLHLLGEQYAATRYISMRCAPSQPKAGANYRNNLPAALKRSRLRLLGPFQKRFTAGEWMGHISRQRVLSRGALRCVRCHLITLHPMLNFLQSNERVDTATFVFLFNPIRGMLDYWPAPELFRTSMHRQLRAFLY